MIKPGTLIKGPQWPVPVEVKLIEEMGDFVRIVGVTRPGDQRPGEHIDQIIPREEWVDCTLTVRQLELERSDRVYGF